MGSGWRLLRHGALRGAANMAVDDAVLTLVAGGSSPPTLRLYRWMPPCLSLGRHQRESVADEGFCRRHGVDIVRRPSGGRAVLHHRELTYAVIAPLGAGGLPGDAAGTYRVLCGALVGAAHGLGVAAEMSSDEVNLQLPHPTSRVPCFEAPAGGEVLVDGRKLIGSAMRVRRGAVLQHGAVLLDWDEALQAGCLGSADGAALSRSVTTFVEQLGRSAEPEEVGRAIARSLEKTLGVELVPGELTAMERAAAERDIQRYAVLTV